MNKGDTCSWKVQNEIEKNEVGNFLFEYFQTSIGTFQLKKLVLNENFLSSNFPISRFFQLLFPTTRIPRSNS